MFKKIHLFIMNLRGHRLIIRKKEGLLKHNDEVLIVGHSLYLPEELFNKLYK